jgi:hypothetical protein
MPRVEKSLSGGSVITHSSLSLRSVLIVQVEFVTTAAAFREKCWSISEIRNFNAGLN